MNNSDSRIYLSPPHMSGLELEYIHDAFDKNWIAPLGDNVDGFERDLQRYTNRKHAAVVSSGTAAIHLGLILCGVEPGDEVICQSFTFAASANPIRYQGATPVFVDSESETWNMDPVLLEQAILDRMQNGIGKGKGKGGVKRMMAQKPKAIVLVHLYGMPAKVDRILEIAAKYDIPVVEDAAEALGSSVRGRKCGTFGTLSVFSFNGNKIITTSGGGALLSDHDMTIEKARFLATQARDDAPHYQHSELGYNYRMSNIVAGIGRGQMEVLDERVKQRRFNHDFYFKALGGAWFDGDFSKFKKGLNSTARDSSTGIYFLRELKGHFSNRWLTAILVNPEETGGITRDDIQSVLEEENIECRPLWKPMHLQPLYEGYPYYGKGISDRLFKYGLCLPSGSNLSQEDRQRIVGVLKKVLKSVPLNS